MWSSLQPLCRGYCGDRALAQHTLKPFSSHFLFSHQQGMIFEKLRICSMPQFVRFVHDLPPLRKHPDVVVKDLRFGTIPVKLYQPKASTSGLRPGIVFYHGGGGILGSLSKSPFLRSFAWSVMSQSTAGWTHLSAGGGPPVIFPGSQSCYYDQGTPGQLLGPRSYTYVYISYIYIKGFSGGSDSKASACNVGNPGLIPGLGRSPGEGNGNAL